MACVSGHGWVKNDATLGSFPKRINEKVDEKVDGRTPCVFRQDRRESCGGREAECFGAGNFGLSLTIVGK
jgi:hypothetical protein